MTAIALDLQTFSPLSRCQGAEGTREHRVLRAQGHRARSHLLVALVAGTACPPPALCSFQTQPCLWTSSHFQATDSMCYLQGIVSKIPPNLKWGGCFPSATLTLRTAEPQSRGGNFQAGDSEQKPEMHTRSNSKQMKKLKERSSRACLCLNYFFKEVWFQGYFLFIFMELLGKRFAWKYKLPSTRWHVGSFLF